MNFNVKLVPVASLRPSPKTLAVHPPFDPEGRDHLLVSSIREKGILEALKVHPDGVIEDGYRRSECARFLKLAKVPAVILEDGLAIFDDMQLGRQLSVFAVCSLQRLRIEELVSRGKVERSNLHPEKQSTALQELQEEWAKLVQAFGKKKRTLQLGVTTLARIDAVRESDPELAAKAETIFRNHGVQPAIDKLNGDSPPKPHDQKLLDEEDEADARDIDYEIDEQLPPEPAKQSPQKQYAVMEPDATDDDSEESASPPAEEPRIEPQQLATDWQKSVEDSIATIERLWIDNARMSPTRRKLLNRLRTINHAEEITS